MRVAAFALAALALAARTSVAQSPAGPWIPLGSRLDLLVRWTIADGGLGGVDPLTRPYRLAAVRRAVADQDTMLLRPSGRRVFGWLLSALDAHADSTAVVIEAGGAGYRNGNRDSFRPGGSARGAAPQLGVWVSMARGPFVAVLNPALDNRLKDDPEYTGQTNRVIAGRLQNGYVALSGERGDLLLGRMARNWGPAGFDGLQLSPSAYATDMLEGTLRLGRFGLTTIAQRLDDLDPDSSAPGVPINRYFLAHRLSVRAGRGTWLSFTETGVYGGPGRGLELAFLAPLNPALLSENNEQKNVNLLWGAQLHARLPGGLTVETELTLDDIRVDNGGLIEERPTSGGATVTLGGALPRLPVHFQLGYTRVLSLTYRNSFEPLSVYMVRGVGIARNYSDYDQLLLRFEALPAANAYVALEASYLRQGSYDFRQPFPSDTVLAQPGQGFLVAPVRYAAGIRVLGAVEPVAGWRIAAQLGATGSATGSQLIAAISVRARFDALRGWHGGDAWTAVEPGTSGDWP